MFQNLANYLLGSVVNQDNGATAEGVENSSIRLITVEKEDDWLLVDRDDSEGNSDTNSVGSFDDVECPEGYSDIPLPSLLKTAGSTSSLPCISNMEESWFVTPPPCFTSTVPIHMETSPLENLLIEHPSMSVYQHISRRYVTNPTYASSTHSYEGELDVEESEVEVGEEQEVVVVVQHRVPRLNSMQIIQQQEIQRLKSRRAQKAQVEKVCKTLKRGYLERNNKAREVNNRNRRQRRGERSQGATRSYANNNRKC